ncbi:hypothetical protein PR003_g8286 [Phytophthora rubi]|uniref:Uncharacterized protein n=1 Tax=Phytophthora rubi TaxID=129364 RepID=A0A6A3MVR4_9STRA|nr:hypothetical protein PR002_g8638 [Phytophthora rubi]KAE9344766.1 hypothetical protein PR003_g8286 [Phytophthora rubi]
MLVGHCSGLGAALHVLVAWERINAAICSGLGADWTGLPTRPSGSEIGYSVAVAGNTGGDVKKTQSGTMIVKVHPMMTNFEVQYVTSDEYIGDGLTASKTVYFGILMGVG